MPISPFETELYERLSDFFARSGFVSLVEKKQFRKSTDTGFQNVIFSVTPYENETWLEVNFGLRHQQLEQTAQQFLSNLAEFRDDANTLVVSIGKFNDTRYFRYKITHDARHGPADLDETCELIKDFLLETGFDFLDQHSHLPELHALLNSEPTKPCKYLYNQTHRAFKGLIAARLSQHADFPRLADVYRNQLLKMGASFHDLHQYERLLSYLLYHSVN
ncbi:MAG: hypothetical protein LH606_12070 [Cytophagaceae bacterium]|nr:hypothetical protein [Cytophagaceae bacterium]